MRNCSKYGIFEMFGLEVYQAQQIDLVVIRFVLCEIQMWPVFYFTTTVEK